LFAPGSSDIQVVLVNLPNECKRDRHLQREKRRRLFGVRLQRIAPIAPIPAAAPIRRRGAFGLPAPDSRSDHACCSSGRARATTWTNPRSPEREARCFADLT